MRRSQRNRINRDAFRKWPPDMFDVAHADVLALTKNTGGTNCMLTEKKHGRRGTAGVVDPGTASKEEAAQGRREKEGRKRKSYHLSKVSCAFIESLNSKQA